MDQHQLAIARHGVLVPAALGCQPDRLHCRPTPSQPIANDAPIEMARPQAVWAVIAVLYPGERWVAGHIKATMAADKSLFIQAAASAAGGWILLRALAA